MSEYLSTDPLAGLDSEAEYLSTDPDFGLESEVPKKPGAGVVGDAVMRVGDTAIALGKGVVGVPQAAVGLADLATGGEAGKAVEDSGVRFKETQDILSGLQSPAQKEANRKVAEADGFVDTLGAAIENPSTIVNATAESLPAMVLGGLIARGGLAGIGAISKTAAEKAALILAGAGEGLVTAGQSAEQLRADDPSGLLSGKGSIASAASGAITGVIGAAAGRLAQKLGIADIDTLIAKGGADAVTAKAAKTGFLKAMAQSGFSEGVLEELPQSAQEQMWQNWAQGKPIAEGVGNQAAMGMLAGAAMGGAGGGYNVIAGRKEVDQPAQPGQAASETPEYRPMSGQGVPLDVGTPEAAPVMPEAGRDISSQAPGVEAAIGRLSELEMLADQRDLTPQEQGEYQALAQTINQETSDQSNQAGIEAQATEPQAQPISEVQPAQSPVSAEPSQSQPIENQEVISEQGQNPAPQETAAAQEVVSEAGAPPQTIPAVGQNAVDQEPLQQEPVQQNPDVVAQDSPADTAIPVDTKKAERIPRAAQEQVRKIDQRIANIESQIPTRSGPVQASLIRESDRLKQEREQLVAKKPTRFKPFADPRLAGNEEVLNQMADQAGWAEVGGQLLRDADGKPSGRTQWLPRADWYAELPKDARMNQADTIAAVNKAINGEPMSAKEKRAVSAMLDHIEHARDNERAPDIGFDEVDPEAAAERQAIIEADTLIEEAPDDKLDALLEASLNGKTGTELTDAELDDIFGPEVVRSPEKTKPSGAAGRDSAGSGTPGQAETQQRRDRKPKAASGAEQGDQGSEQAGGAGSGLSVAGQKAAERFKDNPQKVINNLTSVGRIKELHDAAGVMTSAGFKDLPMADKVAAYVKMVTGETIPGAKKSQDKPVETDLFVNSEEERKALEAKQGVADVAAAKGKKRQGDGAEPSALFSDNPAMAGQVDITDSVKKPSNTEATEIKGSGKKTSNHSKPDQEKLAPGTRVNGELERKQADRLELVVNQVRENRYNDIKRNTKEGNALRNIESVVEELRKPRTVSSVVAILEQASIALGSKFPPVSDLVSEIADILSGEVPDKSTVEVEAPKQNQSIDLDQQAKLDQERFKDNKLFTADKVAAARARLKSKLGTLNSGFDPELALDGMTIAGAYIESGIKAYADYTKAMIADLGEGVRPYLRSFYESVRAYPGMDKTGMTSYADLESMQGENLDDKSPVIGDQPKVEKQKFNPLGNLTLKQDWGVEHIDGYDSERDDGKGGKIKTEFLNNAKKYLNQLADLLAKEGFEPHKDKKGKAEKPVSINEGGPAVSGDVSLTMRKGDSALHIKVGAASVRGLSGNHPQGVSIMARVAGNADSDRYATRGMNHWLPVTASTADLAKWAITQVGRVEDNAKFKEAQDYAKRPQNTEQAPVETGNSEADRSPRGNSQPNSGSVGVGMAEANQETGETGATDSGGQKTGGTRTGSGRVRAPKQLDGRNRGEADSGRGSESGATKPDSVSLPSEPKADFTATAETAEAITEGGQKTKARANIAAIKLVKQLVAEDRRATMDEQKTLARYVGWGGIKQIFDEDNTAWSSLRTELKNILTAEEYAAANRSILDAHYTGLDVVNGMWGIAKHLGFKGGRLLEPSMGVGNFFGANTAPTPSLVDLFEKMGKRSSKSAPAEIDQHPKAALIRAVQDNWTDVLLQVGFENIDKSDNPNGKVFIQC